MAGLVRHLIPVSPASDGSVCVPSNPQFANPVNTKHPHLSLSVNIATYGHKN